MIINVISTSLEFQATEKFGNP